MFDDYKIALRDFYKEQKNSNKLSPGMENPTCLILKKEFFNAYSSNHTNHDTDSIKRFFTPAASYEDQLKNIDHIELDKLKPFINLMKSGTILRDEASVVALAWLLGFVPYSEWKALKGEVTTQPLNDGSTSGNNSTFPDQTVATEEPISNGDQTVTPTDDPAYKRTFPKIFFIDIAIILLLLITLIWQGILGYRRYKPSPAQKCMYWDGYRYVPTECDRYSNEQTTIPLDARVLYNLKKIRWPDLLTKKDIGKVWYVRIDSQHEYFTDSGQYPLDPQKKLKPLSNYILSNHVSYFRFILKCLFWSTLIGVILYVRIKKYLVATNSVATSNRR